MVAIYVNKTYQALRFFGWLLLAIFIVVQAVWTRRARGLGWQLHRIVLFTTWVYTIAEAILLAYAAMVVASNYSNATAVLRAYLFFEDLGEATFLGLLLLISSGYCITSSSFAKYAAKVLIIPPIYFVSMLIVEYGYIAANGTSLYDDNGSADSLQWAALPRWFQTAVALASLANFFALMLAWLFIFDNTGRERELLMLELAKVRGEVVVDNVGGLVDNSPTGAQQHQQQHTPGGNLLHPGANQSHLPAHEHLDEIDMLSTPRAGDAADVEYGASDAAPREPVDTQQLTALQTKHTLLTRFSWAVALYVIATAAVIILALFESARMAKIVVVVLKNVVDWGFMLALALIFRPREDNPYLLMIGMDEGTDHVVPTTELAMVDSNGHALRPADANALGPALPSGPKQFKPGDDEDAL